VASGAAAASAADASAPAPAACGEAPASIDETPPAAADSAASALGPRDGSDRGVWKLLKCLDLKERIEQPGISEEQLARELRTANRLQRKLNDVGIMLRLLE
jgi:hypothetical protein